MLWGFEITFTSPLSNLGHLSSGPLDLHYSSSFTQTKGFFNDHYVVRRGLYESKKIELVLYIHWRGYLIIHEHYRNHLTLMMRYYHLL